VSADSSTAPINDRQFEIQFRDQVLRFTRSRGANRDARALRDSYASLTRREREVMALVVSGLLNKQVGGELDISEITVKAHRGSVMRKMNARSLPRLVEMAARLGLSPQRSRSH
jgi:FixJ family two-component response regulator